MGKNIYVKIQEYLKEEHSGNLSKDKLKDKLLSFGGKEVKLGLDTESELSRMINDGELMEPVDYNHLLRNKIPFEHSRMLSTISLETRNGAQSQCHRNSAEMYKKGKNEIMSGYALSDNVWYQHSWIYEPSSMGSGTLVETTSMKYDKYFGYELNKEENIEFCDENY